MSRVIIGVLLIICLLFSANGLNRMLPEKPRLNSNMGRRGFTLQMIASMLNINRLVVGWLWVQFDSDSTNLSKNYHRLLPTLELITAIQPDEFVAHGLLCYMRCVHAKNSDETEKYKEAYTELERASKEFPNNPRGHYELAYINAIFLKDYEKALPYAKVLRINFSWCHEIKIF
jgi:tetratricopeptide (TPR) repeat protein